MARVEITRFTAGNRSREGASLPVAHLGNMRTEVLEVGKASVVTTLPGDEADGTGFVRVRAEADVWIVAGPAPVAEVPASGATRSGLRVSAGIAMDFAVARGDRIAVIEL